MPLPPADPRPAPEDIAFSSAFQLPVNPEWANGAFEPGVDLWMGNADGSGAPTRLTYDYPYSEANASWAPNPPTGREVSVTKGDATATFRHVHAEGSTTVCVTPQVPGPAPAGYAFLGRCWELFTTAVRHSHIGLDLRCDPSLVPAGQTPRMLAWDGDRWQDVTAGVDTERHVISGRRNRLTHFTLALMSSGG